MTAVNILIYVALIGYVLFKKVQGQPLKTPKRLFALPVILVVIGYGDLANGEGLKPIEVTLTVIGALLSLALGGLRGRADKLTTRDGSPFMQWGATSLALFVGNLAAKLVLDLIGIAAGGTASGAGKSLIFTLGLTLLGEAVVLFLRSGGAPDLLNQSRAATAQPPRSRTDRFSQPTPPPEPSDGYQTNGHASRASLARGPGEPNDGQPTRQSTSHGNNPGWARRRIDQPAQTPTGGTTSARDVAEAIQRHHNHHHDHHRHDHRERP